VDPLELALVDAREEDVDLLVRQHVDVGRRGVLALERDRVLLERAEVVAVDVPADADRRDEHGGDREGRALEDPPADARRSQLGVARDGAAQALLRRTAHTRPFMADMPTRRRVWDSNPRSISACWSSRPVPSAARTTLPRRAWARRTRSSLDRQSTR